MPSPTKKLQNKTQNKMWILPTRLSKKKKEGKLYFHTNFCYFHTIVDEIIKISVKFNTNTNFCYFHIISAEIT